MNAVLDIFQAAGITVKENSFDCDAAVIWSVLWNGRMKPNQAVYTHYRSTNRPVVIIEIGALYRNTTWKISVNHITNQGYYGHTLNLDWDRPRKLKISLATSLRPKPNIMLALQHQRSLQVADIADMVQWTHNQITMLRQHTDRPIVIRPHPRSSVSLGALPSGVTIETPKRIPNTYDSFDMHFDCHAVVNHNSGPGIQAAIAGIRPVVDGSSLAQPVSVTMADIEKPYDLDRYLWLVQICHTEYTLEEIKSGLWLKRIRSALVV